MASSYLPGVSAEIAAETTSLKPNSPVLKVTFSAVSSIDTILETVNVLPSV